MAIVAATRVSPRTRTMAPAVILPQRLQQARSLHFGLWCSHFKSEHRRDCRRHRVSRYRYMDTISRKLSWDNGSRSHDARLAMKRAMAHLMSDKRTADPKYVNPDKVQSWSDDISGLRPGRNIEDAERDAIDHLFRSRGNASYEHDLWMSPLRNIQNYLSSHHAPKDVSPEDVITATTDHHVHTPPRQSKPKGARHTTSRRRHFRKNAAAATPHVLHDQAPSSSFTAAFEDLSPPAGMSKTYSDLDKYKPVSWNEPDGLQPKTSEELSKNYEDLDKYTAAQWNEPDGLPSSSPEELSKKYDDLDKYTAVQWNEPHGLPPKTAEELSKNYNDLDKYTAVQWNEPEGLPNPTPEELSKQYDDLDKYKPVEWNEPDGLREATPEERSKNYDDLDTYSGPFTAPVETIEAHETAQLDGTAKAEPLQAKVDVCSPPVEYDDLHKYGPVHWNEPDGLRKPTPEEESKNYDDLHLYGPVEWNEPNGQPKPTPEEQSKNYPDLPAYEANTYSEPEIIPTHVHPEEASKAYEDLDSYRSAQLDSVDKPYPMHPEEASKAYADLEAYKPVYYNEPNGVASAQSSSEDSGLDAFDKRAQYASTLDPRSKHYLAEEPEDMDTLSAEQIRARVGQDGTDRARQSLLNEDKTHYETAWDVASAEAQETVKQSKQASPISLTGNFVRDFPEEFAVKWATHDASASLLPKRDPRAAITGEEISKDDVEFSSMDESFPMAEQRLEPALDRATLSRHMSESSLVDEVADPYSKIPQGLETSYAEECAGSTTWPTMVRHYHAESAATEPTTSVRGSTAESTLAEGTYKVLAFDRTNQTVSVADMTSGVLDQQPALSPSEVMLKLSNPARFLPHFGPLHSQGYEVVSGSGDVLIFRKVRQASPDAAAGHFEHGPVNPIDLMGKPVMGNFASPTGFVNYESLADNDTLKPEPPFRSNIDVRREEPVFSGARAEQEHSRSKKKSLGRKLAVGGAWTVGIAYAVGVMAEYFSTGGLDGLGPRGL